MCGDTDNWMWPIDGRDVTARIWRAQAHTCFVVEEIKSTHRLKLQGRRGDNESEHCKVLASILDIITEF